MPIILTNFDPPAPCQSWAQLARYLCDRVNNIELGGDGAVDIKIAVAIECFNKTQTNRLSENCKHFHS
jgi:hypothetical protein